MSVYAAFYCGPFVRHPRISWKFVELSRVFVPISNEELDGSRS